MNYDFLQSYSMPRQTASNQYTSSSNSMMDGAYGSYAMPPTQSTPTVNTAYYGYGGSSVYNDSYSMYSEKMSSATGSACETYQYPERYVSSTKQVSGYISNKASYKRKSSTIAGGSSAKKETIREINSDGTLAMFMGRDESYPDALNSLIHPLSCELCNTKMNSTCSAKDHYESKVHDKSITSWINKNYTEKGLNPPSVKRFVKQGNSGPNAYYCEVCDLKLTSITHANQHYGGKKHRLVVAQKSKPSGAGYYTAEGKWVRTATKVSKQSKDRRFGIGESFKYTEFVASSENAKNGSGTGNRGQSGATTTSLADTTTVSEGDGNNPDQDPSLFCSVCKINVTSAVQMAMHLSGSKHTKKLKLNGGSSSDPESKVSLAPIKDNVLLSAIKEEIKPDPTDLSMYRTPSGEYYCKTCNISISHMQALEQHLKGKRHLKKLTEARALAVLTSKKN